MNPALTYLSLRAFTQLVKRCLINVKSPSKILLSVLVLGVTAVLIEAAKRELTAARIRPSAWLLLVFFWLIGCLLYGISAKRESFKPSDTQHLILGPFSKNETIFYLLLPSYLLSIGAAFASLLVIGPLVERPIVTSFSIALGQIIICHLSGLMRWSDKRRRQLLWMAPTLVLILAAIVFVLLSYNYATGELLRQADRISIICLYPFFSAGTVTDIPTGFIFAYFAVLSAGAAGSFILLSVWTSPCIGSAENYGEEHLLHAPRKLRPISVATSAKFFRGTRSLAWRKAMLALRSKRDFGYTVVFVSAYVFAVRYLIRQDLQFFDIVYGLERAMVGAEQHAQWRYQAMTFAIFAVGVLGLLLQRAFPFDFRSDANRWEELRSLPFNSFSICAAEISVSIALTLFFQSIVMAFFYVDLAIDRKTLALSSAAIIMFTFGIGSAVNVFELFGSKNTAFFQQSPISKNFLGMLFSALTCAPALLVYKFFLNKGPVATAVFSGLIMQLMINIALFWWLTFLFRTQECESHLELSQIE